MARSAPGRRPPPLAVRPPAIGGRRSASWRLRWS